MNTYDADQYLHVKYLLHAHIEKNVINIFHALHHTYDADQYVYVIKCM